MLVVKWKDLSGMKRLDNALARVTGPQKHMALQRALNHTGDKARTAVTRVLSKQTGLPYGVVKKALKINRAYGGSTMNGGFVVHSDANLSYSITSSGGDISLKYFKARETRAGVVASPHGKPQLFAGAFIKGGHFPNRKGVGMGDHVYQPNNPGRTGKSTWRRGVHFMDSGVIIPAEMISGASAKAFTDIVENDLPKRTMHELGRIAPDVFS